MHLRDFDDDLDDQGWRDETSDDEPGDDSDDSTMPCPACHRPVYDDAERCPGCGVYLSREDNLVRKPWWVVAGVLACLAMVTYWILHP